MRRALLRLLITAALTLTCVAYWCTGEGHAAVLTTATPAPATVQTCIPRKIIYFGATRWDNDLFAGSRGGSCITVNPVLHSLTLDTSYLPGTAGVVAYPKVYIGQNYGSSDPESPLPIRVTRAQHLTVHVAALGNTTRASNYITDLDMWFSTSRATASQHGTAELVVALRWQHGDWGGREVSIAGHPYLVNHWITGDGTQRWPIYVIRAIGQVTSRSFHVANILWHLRKLGWQSSAAWLDSVNFGTEVWGGGKGLTDAMTVTNSP